MKTILKVAVILLSCSGTILASFIGAYRHYKVTNTLVDTVVGHPMKDYLGYGNYCGLGGSGPVVDPIDNCCRLHDLCYNEMSITYGCPGVTDMYKLGIKTDTYELTCDAEDDACWRGVCKCDFELLACMRINNIFYDKSHLKRGGYLSNLFKFVKTYVHFK